MEECISNSIVAEKLLHERMRALDHEEVWLIYLTTASRLIGCEMVSRGTLDRSAIDNRTILRQGLLHNAGALIVIHNHPSGDPRPSREDVRFTSSLKKACGIVGIGIVDHIIVAGERFFSFSDEIVRRAER